LAPRYIVAFRGTVLTDPCTAARDLYLDGNVVLNTQHDRHRFRHARERVQQLFLDNNNIADASDVWLAGHSLGASIALDVGHDLAAREGRRLPTFLLNPPHVSLAPAADKLGMAEKAKRDMHFTSSLLKNALGKTDLIEAPDRAHGRAVQAALVVGAGALRAPAGHDHD
jgi:thioesterase domain-containing protein